MRRHMPAGAKRPNIVLLITDQQRTPMHWPDDPGWLAELMPNEAELRATALSFEQACTATAMCSPSRATFLTGTYPSRHGVTLTLTNADLQPNPEFLPAVLREARDLYANGAVPRGRLVELVPEGRAADRPEGRRRARAVRPAGRRSAPACVTPATPSSTRASGTSRRRWAAGTPGARPMRSGCSGSSASGAGRRPTPARTPTRPTSAAATRDARAWAGTRTTSGRSRRSSPPRRCRSRSA